MIVDGGYLIWNLAYGSYDLWEQTFGKEIEVFALDSPSIRKEEFDFYKKDRRQLNEDEIFRLASLRERINTERIMPLCKVEGLEADDIVACYKLFYPEMKIIGIDKDFFQVADILFNHKNEEYTKANLKISSYLEPLAKHNFALYQMLVGDTIDRVPRILGRYSQGKEQVQMIVDNYIDLHDTLLNMFEEKIVDNAKLVLFPHYSYYQGSDWFKAFCEGTFHNPENWTNLWGLIQKNTLPNRYDSVSRQLNLFP